METITKWDMAEVLDTKEDIVACLEVALAQNNVKFLLETLGTLARSQGMMQTMEPPTNKTQINPLRGLAKKMGSTLTVGCFLEMQREDLRLEEESTPFATLPKTAKTYPANQSAP